MAKNRKDISKRKRINAQQRKARYNRIRAHFNDFNITDEQCEAYHRAIKNKKTPYEFLEDCVADVKTQVNVFSAITDLASSPEFMEVVEKHEPELHKSLVKSNELLTECLKEADLAWETHNEALKDLTSTELDFLQCGEVLEDISNIQNNLQDNLAPLMGTIERVFRFQAKVEQLCLEEEAKKQKEESNEEN